MKPTCAARQSASSPSRSCAMFTPPISMVPPVGWSMPAIRFSKVLLPEPLGPIRAMNSASLTSRSTPSSTGMNCSPRW
jgi:hypothetical protein